MRDIREAGLAETAAGIAAAGGRAAAFALDVSDAAAIEATLAAVEGRFGPMRLMATNAGVAMHGVPLHGIALADWDGAIGVAVMGVVHGIRSAVPWMLAQGLPCHIVNAASTGGSRSTRTS